MIETNRTKIKCPITFKMRHTHKNSLPHLFCVLGTFFQRLQREGERGKRARRRGEGERREVQKIFAICEIALRLLGHRVCAREKEMLRVSCSLCCCLSTRGRRNDRQWMFACNAMLCFAMQCHVLQCVAMVCNVLQWLAMCYNGLQYNVLHDNVCILALQLCPRK